MLPVPFFVPNVKRRLQELAYKKLVDLFGAFERLAVEVEDPLAVGRFAAVVDRDVSAARGHQTGQLVELGILDGADLLTSRQSGRRAVAEMYAARAAEYRDYADTIRQAVLATLAPASPKEDDPSEL